MSQPVNVGLSTSRAHVRNTVGCCDGSGQVHHGEGALSYVTLCRDAACVARREAAWAAECGETPASGEERTS